MLTAQRLCCHLLFCAAGCLHGLYASAQNDIPVSAYAPETASLRPNEGIYSKVLMPMQLLSNGVRAGCKTPVGRCGAGEFVDLGTFSSKDEVDRIASALKKISESAAHPAGSQATVQPDCKNHAAAIMTLLLAAWAGKMMLCGACRVILQQYIQPKPFWLRRTFCFSFIDRQSS